MNKNLLFRILRVTAVTLVAIQILPLDRSVPDYNKKLDFAELNLIPRKQEQVLKTACYDCHSYQTKYPWYGKVAPISFVTQKKIEKGRKHLNFSTWNLYSDDEKKILLEKSIKTLNTNAMPPKSYTWMHEEASLSEWEKKEFVEALKNVE